MKYHQLIKMAEDKLKKGEKILENDVSHLNLKQKVLHSYPNTPHFDFGEVLPHHRILHNVELGRKMINVIDRPMVGKNGHGQKPTDYDRIVKPMVGKNGHGQKPTDYDRILKKN